MKNRLPWVRAIGAVSAALITTVLVTACSSPSAQPGTRSVSGPPAASVSSISPQPTPAPLASLVQVRSFGANPTKLGMWLYVPHSVRPHPAIVLAIHYCTGSGPAYFRNYPFYPLADKYGFIIIYPSSHWLDGCFDASSPPALKHDGGSDPLGLMSMVTYTERKYHADPNRVYVTGTSGGAIETAVMLGDYPEVFKAGAIFMGMPFGCLAGPVPDGTNIGCNVGSYTLTPQKWGDMVRAAYPGYRGPRPRVQIWHGTADQTISFREFGQEIAQWTNVFGVSQTPLATDHPQQGWTRTVYGTSKNDIKIEAYSIQGATHELPLWGMEAWAIHFFGLDRG